VIGASYVGTDEDGVRHVSGGCLTIGVPKSGQQSMPTDDEIAAPLYLPPLDPNDAGVPPVPECRDADRSVPAGIEPTLAALKANLFAPACSFSACHSASAAGGLDLTAEDLHAELLEHDVVANISRPLVEPGDPDGSWLVDLLTKCEPADDDGNVLPHMPLNAPVLLDAALVNGVRAWIEAGAPAD
jgi:hypothetical protein